MIIPASLSLNTIKRLLIESQPFIEQHGFKIEAIRAAISSGKVLNEKGVLIKEEDIQSSFSSKFDLTKQLLTTFDQQSLKKSLHSINSTSGSIIRDQSDSISTKSDKHENEKIEKVELLLAGKLLQSATIREQLVEALAILTASAEPSIIPGASLPIPVMQRAWNITDEAIYLAEWKGKLRTDWYSHRTRLTNAFMLSELHLLSPEFKGDVHESLHVLRKLAKPDKLLGSETIKSASQWVDWGAKGWLGIFRSLGL